RFSIDLKSRLNIDKELIQQVVALKKPVILELNHETRSAHWGSLLKPSKQYKETKVLRDFASANNISGFLIAELFVDDDNTFLQFNPNVGPNLPCYISQLKGDSNLIIGLGIPPYGILIKNTCAYNFAELNSIVDFYYVESRRINPCLPDVFNGVVPVGKTEHGTNYYLGLEEISEILSETQIDKKKLVYVLQFGPYEKDVPKMKSYHHVCTNQYNCSTWCIENTKNFFSKGVFVRKQNAGCSIAYFELDDIQNECGCGAFIGVKNIVAGYRGGEMQPCAKFDVKSSTLI
ncbi:uncharacterized protein LOC112683137, partial [Sipha flava]